MSVKLKLFFLIGLTFLLPSCRWFVRPESETVFAEQVLGSYSYEDSSSAYTGRFLIIADKECLSLDLFGPMHILVSSIRYNPESTLVYLPLDNTVLIMGEEAFLPFEDWHLPLTPLVAGYRGEVLVNPDSSYESGDTLVQKKGGIEYVFNSLKLTQLRSGDWELSSEGELIGSELKPERLRFTRKDMELVMYLTSLEIVELESDRAFNLKFPACVNILDFR
ncbi:hypothetical protein GF359_04080 [candidate division WOR-3 bacterium]|uniref:DUF4292 domain-containing protein n=1 Tax=candidate division WOR-3 bacterium TaxID=2052148 RepID=A0A9D5QCV0_UNCW3|nr:hypothetical protein [candidate division WOR-3 bacterium]MBD3364376.1 hypothetical protein [candidate division WOR-3 bacterium]